MAVAADDSPVYLGAAMLIRHNKCSLYIVAAPGSPMTPSFLTDLAEALNQIKNRELDEFGVLFSAGDTTIPDLFSRLAEQIPTQFIPLEPDRSLVEWLNTALCRSVDRGNDTIFVAGNITLAPNTLSVLCATANQTENLGIISARLFGEQNPSKLSPDFQEQAFGDFLSESDSLEPLQPIDAPPALCIMLPRRLVIEVGTLPINVSSVGEALFRLAENAKSAKFLNVLDNRAFHCVAPQVPVDEFLFKPETTIVEGDGDSPLLDEAPLYAHITSAELKERFFRLNRCTHSSLTSLAIDLSFLPSHYSPSFELGLLLSSAMHSRRIWETTLISPSPIITKMWSLKSRFPNASVVHTSPKKCYDYALSPVFPRDLTALKSLVELSSRPFAVGYDLFARHSNGTLKDHQVAQNLYSTGLGLLRGVVLFGEQSPHALRTNLPVFKSTPVCPILPSMFYREYARAGETVKPDFRKETVIILQSEGVPEAVSESLLQLSRELPQYDFVCVGSTEMVSNNMRFVSWEELTLTQWLGHIEASLFVVAPIVEDKLSAEIGRILSYGKVVVSLRNKLVEEMKQRWIGPRGILVCQRIDDLTESIKQLVEPSQRARLSVMIPDQTPDSSTWKWGQLGHMLNEFLRTTAPISTSFEDDHIRNWLMLSSIMTCVFPHFEQALHQAHEDISIARQTIRALEKKLSSHKDSSDFSEHGGGPQKKHAFQQAIEAFQEWASKAKST